MFKQDVMAFISQSNRLEMKQGGNGAVNLLAEILSVSPATISQMGEIVPIKKAKDLHKFFRDKEKLKEYGLPLKGAPRFDIELHLKD